MSADTLISVAIVSCGAGALALWIWRIAKLQTPDYDIEEHLPGTWEPLDFELMGRTCRSSKRLIRTWDGLYVMIDLRVQRAALLSLAEEYRVMLSSSTPLPDDKGQASQFDTYRLPSFGPCVSGSWQVAAAGKGRVVARAQYPLCRWGAVC